jgi:rare lipoprotein A (peptidoglycan hydrolase)
VGSIPKLRLKPRLHKRRLACGAYAVAALIATAAGLLLTAPVSQALSQVGARAEKHAAPQNHAAPRGFRRRVASWYYDDVGTPTACGFRANYGVANKKLPCGTHVTFWRAGHMVKAIVDDRGPYVAGRTWDLDQHTARALHFRGIGVGYVWARW